MQLCLTSVCQQFMQCNCRSHASIVWCVLCTNTCQAFVVNSELRPFELIAFIIHQELGMAKLNFDKRHSRHVLHRTSTNAMHGHLKKFNPYQPHGDLHFSILNSALDNIFWLLVYVAIMVCYCCIS
jgi:hypothetical protein